MEIWKNIPGYEGLYEASNQGRIRSVDGKTTSNKRYASRVWKSRVLSPKQSNKSRRNDLRVELWKDGEHKTLLVARLVALAWLGIPDSGMTVNHINGDWLDNRPSNLEWVTLSENIRKGVSSGLYSSCQLPVTIRSESGDEQSFPSMAAAGRWLGRSNKYVSMTIKDGRTSLFSASGQRYLVV